VQNGSLQKDATALPLAQSIFCHEYAPYIEVVQSPRISIPAEGLFELHGNISNESARELLATERKNMAKYILICGMLWWVDLIQTPKKILNQSTQVDRRFTTSLFLSHSVFVRTFFRLTRHQSLSH
jgi:hypothetical protein